MLFWDYFICRIVAMTDYSLRKGMMMVISEKETYLGMRARFAIVAEQNSKGSWGQC